VVVPEISEGYAALVLSGSKTICWKRATFILWLATARADLIEEYPHLLQQSAVEGLIAVDTECRRTCRFPSSRSPGTARWKV